MNGVSKKLCMTAAGIVAVTQLADGAADKMPFAIIIGAICMVHIAVQCFSDWKK